MKLLLTLISFFSILVVNGQAGHEGHNHGTPAASPAGAKNENLKLKEETHDFGKIPQGKPVFYNFEVLNTGVEPLKLENVQASCGCTTPEWSKEAIAAGGSSLIKVGYNAAAEGPFLKDITITYAGGNTKLIKITGNVWKAPEGSAPTNASVQFLKKQNL